LLGAGALVWGGGAQRGIKRDVGRLLAAMQRARLDVAPALAVGARARAASCGAARQLVELGLQLARRKLGAALDLLSAFPPIGV
jgi:hypothetical protein